MFQLKISAAILIVVLALMGFAHFALTSSVSESLVRGADSELDTARRAVDDARLLAETSLLEQTDAVAADPLLRTELGRLQQMALNAGGLEPLKDQLNRARLFGHLLSWRKSTAKRLEERYGRFDSADAAKLHASMRARPVVDWWGTAPDLVLAFVATPLKGDRVAHVLVTHAEDGQEIAPALDYADNLPVLRAAEKAPSTAVINWTIHEYFVVAAPVYAEGSEGEGRTLVGTVVLGYQLDAGLAERLGAVTGGEVPVIVYSDKRLYAPGAVDYKDGLLAASSFHPVEDGAEARIDDDSELAWADLEHGRSYVIELDAKRTLMIQRAGWTLGDGDSGVGVVVVDDLGQAMQPLDDLRFQIPLVGAVILIVALVITTLVIRRFLSPLEDLAVGIQEILAGNRDYLFRARAGNPLQGELVNSLNQLTAYLQGRAAPGEADQGWDEMMVDLEPERPSIYGMQAVAVVHSDSERKALRRLYDDYMARRQELDQHVDMDFDRFCRRIKRNEAALKEKHNATAVDFGVAIADGKVVLKPTLRFD